MTRLLICGAAALLSVPALAEPVSRTVTIETPRFEGSRTVTRDREAGLLSREAELTRLSDGAVASRDYQRQRTESGIVASGSKTRFNGDTRSFEYERNRTPNGYVASGSATGFNGKSYSYDARFRKGENGWARGQIVRNSDGKPVAGRKTIVRRADNGTVHRRSVTRRPGRRGH